MSTCGQDHPELPLVCESRGSQADHPEHYAIGSDGLIEWTNGQFIAAKVVTGSRSSVKKHLQEVAARVRSKESIATSSRAQTEGITSNDAKDTSKKAALAIAPKTGTQRRRVLDYITASGMVGATDEETQDFLSMSPSSVRPRRGELVDGGWIEDSGKRRKTVAGLEAIVWIASDKEEVS